MDPLEFAVLRKLLEGDHPVLASLRLQAEGLSVAAREKTGAGFFTKFATAVTSEPAPVNTGKLRFGDVEATISGLANGAGFLLYVDEGRLSMLEGYSYEEPWPNEVKDFSLRFANADRAAVLAKIER